MEKEIERTKGAIEQQAADIAQLQRTIGALETQIKNARERGEDVTLLEEDRREEKKRLTAKEQSLAAKEQLLVIDKQSLAAKEQSLAAKEQLLVIDKQSLAAKEQLLVIDKQSLAAKEQLLAAKEQSLAIDKQQKAKATRDFTVQMWDDWRSSSKVASTWSDLRATVAATLKLDPSNFKMYYYDDPTDLAAGHKIEEGDPEAANAETIYIYDTQGDGKANSPDRTLKLPASRVATGPRGGSFGQSSDRSQLFRNNVNRLFEGRCVITGDKNRPAEHSLPSCHIVPIGKGNRAVQDALVRKITNDVLQEVDESGNGIVLVSQVHTDYDTFSLSINPNDGCKVCWHGAQQCPEYLAPYVGKPAQKFALKKLILPGRRELLAWHHSECLKRKQKPAPKKRGGRGGGQAGGEAGPSGKPESKKRKGEEQGEEGGGPSWSQLSSRGTGKGKRRAKKQ